MRTWTAHVADLRPPELVREGFSWPAALFGPAWLAVHRAWVPAAILLAACVLLAVLVRGPACTVLFTALSILTGLLGGDLVRWSLARRGFREEHVVAGRDEDAAYARLLAARGDLRPPGLGAAP